MNSTMLYNMYGGLIPSGRGLYLPWNESQASIPRDGVINQERPGFLPNVINELNITRNFRIHAGSMSSVTLMPSPGEQFWLKINCFNNRLKRMKAKLSIQVSVTVLLSTVSAHRIINILKFFRLHNLWRGVAKRDPTAAGHAHVKWHVYLQSLLRETWEDVAFGASAAKVQRLGLFSINWRL